MASEIAMVTCERCGKQYSVEWDSCPHCTVALTREESQTQPLRRPPTITPHPSSEGEALTPQHVVLLQALPSGMCITLPHDTTVILGREATGELPTDDSIVALNRLGAQRHGVSRQHCLIERHEGGLIVSDLGSTNGTYLNDRRLEQHQPYALMHGDRLILGTLHLMVFFGAVDPLLSP